MPEIDARNVLAGIVLIAFGALTCAVTGFLGFPFVLFGILLILSIDLSSGQNSAPQTSAIEQPSTTAVVHEHHHFTQREVIFRDTYGSMIGLREWTLERDRTQPARPGDL